MFDPTDFTDEGIKKWAAEQIVYGTSIKENDARHGHALKLSENAYALQTKLFQPDPNWEDQRRKILADLLTQSGKASDGSRVPPGFLEQAYRESHTEVIALVHEIIELRTLTEADC